MDYFYTQNEAIRNGSRQGTELRFESLTIVSGLIDAAIQYSYYVPFAVNNTYGLKLFDDTLASYATFANEMAGGCQANIALCRAVTGTTPLEKLICTKAVDMCRDNIESLYTYYSGRYIYDIRSPASPVQGYPGVDFIQYLNLPEVQQAIGVEINYTNGNSEYQYIFQQSGDWILDFKDEISRLLSRGIRVTLMHGDADWICNWFGGEAVSLAIEYEHADQFKASGYAPLTVDGTQFGETREFGNLSFSRVYDSGHSVTVLSPKAGLALFNRALLGQSAIDGTPLKDDQGTSGPATATHVNTLPSYAPTAAVSAGAPPTGVAGAGADAGSI